MPSVTYPFDTTGLSPANLIVDEIHTLTEINDTTYRIIIPEFAPFYLDNFILKHVDALGNVNPLTEGLDYHLCLPYIGATRSIGKMLYGGISITTLFVNGTIKITYQTLGGEWTADANFVLARLADMVYNPRITVWDIVTNKPNQFPPINHNLNMDYVFGHQDLITGITDLADIIANAPSQSNSLVTHLLDDANPHEVTKAQVGLGNLSNLPLATDQDIADRLPLNKYVTLKQVLDLIIQAP